MSFNRITFLRSSSFLHSSEIIQYIRNLLRLRVKRWEVSQGQALLLWLWHSALCKIQHDYQTNIYGSSLDFNKYQPVTLSKPFGINRASKKYHNSFSNFIFCHGGSIYISVALCWNFRPNFPLQLQLWYQFELWALRY